jgi:ATP-dependent Clp protease ATP-binding subunit ClpX
MIDAMFDLPSQEIKEIHVDLEYAREKFEKTDIKRLRAA